MDDESFEIGRRVVIQSDEKIFRQRVRAYTGRVLESMCHDERQRIRIRLRYGIFEPTVGGAIAPEILTEKFESVVWFGPGTKDEIDRLEISKDSALSNRDYLSVVSNVLWQTVGLTAVAFGLFGRGRRD